MKEKPTGLCVECAEKRNLVPRGVNTTWSGICIDCKQEKQLLNEKRDFIYKDIDDLKA